MMLSAFHQQGLKLELTGRFNKREDGMVVDGVHGNCIAVNYNLF